jgi:hypothetical protein
MPRYRSSASPWERAIPGEGGAAGYASCVRQRQERPAAAPAKDCRAFITARLSPTRERFGNQHRRRHDVAILLTSRPATRFERSFASLRAAIAQGGASENLCRGQRPHRAFRRRYGALRARIPDPCSLHRQCHKRLATAASTRFAKADPLVLPQRQVHERSSASMRRSSLEPRRRGPVANVSAAPRRHPLHPGRRRSRDQETSP